MILDSFRNRAVLIDGSSTLELRSDRSDCEFIFLEAGEASDPSFCERLAREWGDEFHAKTVQYRIGDQGPVTVEIGGNSGSTGETQ